MTTRDSAIIHIAKGGESAVFNGVSFTRGDADTTFYLHPNLNQFEIKDCTLVSPPIQIQAAASIDDPPEWRGPIMPLNQATDETGLKRIFDAGGYDHRELPLTFKGDHDSLFSKGETIGAVTRLWIEDGWVWGEGVFTNTTEGREARRLAEGGLRNYVSVELNIEHATESETDEVFIDSEDWGSIYVMELFVDEWKITGLAVVDTQAFEGARIEVIDGEPMAMVASAFPQKPPAEFFQVPHFDEWTRLTITDEGRIMGHAWRNDQPHIAFDGFNVIPPEDCDFDTWFHRGQVETAEGEKVAVGVVTLYSADGGHRGGANAREVMRQYDSAATIAALVRVEYDDIGGALSGWVLPDLAEADLTRFRAAQVSGHWVDPDGKSGLQLLGLLTVPIQGFPNGGQFLELAASSNPRLETWVCRDGTCVLAASGAVTEEATEEVETTEAIIGEGIEEVNLKTAIANPLEERVAALEHDLAPVIAEQNIGGIADPVPLGAQLDDLLEGD